MSLDVRDRVALVTGGGTGIGFEISSRLAQRGARLAITYSQSRDEAEAAAEQLRALGTECLVRRTDVSRAQAADELVTAVVERFGRLDVVVNSAGTTRFVPFTDLAAITEQVWDDILDVNLKGAFFVSRAAGLWMRDRGAGGAIVNVASIAGLRPSGSSLPYSVSKAGLIHATRGLALALAPSVRVNAVAPGLVLTRWWTRRPAEEVERIVANTAFKRALDAGEVADAALLLITNESISGQTLAVDLANVMH